MRLHPRCAIIIGLALGLGTLGGLSTPAWAMRTPSRPSVPRQHAKVAARLKARIDRAVRDSLPERSRAESTRQEFRITEQTHIELDGRPCRYADVPDGAVILFLEAASAQDGTILRIHFRSPK